MEPGEWMTLSAAASRLGWARARVESRARREEWPKRQPNRGTAMEYLVPASVLVEPATVADGVETDRDAIGDSVMAEALAELQREVTELATVAAAAKGELAAELRRSSDLAAALSKAEARADRLDAALAEARRPWLAKVLEGLRRKGS
jgi:hypothetical protein